MRLIRTDVQKYHLKKSRNKALTWIGCFFAFGTVSPLGKPKVRASKKRGASWGDDFSYSSASSGDVGESSSDSSSSYSSSSDTSSDSGGASGGGGASGDL